MVYNKGIFQYLCQFNDENDILNKLDDEINVMRNSINYNDLVININNSNNIINQNVILKEIFDAIWISLGFNGYIMNCNNNYILLRDGFDYLYKSLFKSIFAAQIINTNGISNILIILIDEKWKCINQYFSQQDNLISSVNIYIYYSLIFEAVDIIFNYLNSKHHHMFLWILLTNIVDISKMKCRDINSISCILDINNNDDNLSLNLKPEFYNMASKNYDISYYRSNTDYSRGSANYKNINRRPATASNLTSFNQSKQEFINEMNEYKEAGIPFGGFLATSKRPSSVRPSSANIVPTFTRPINPKIETIGTTKWKMLSNLLQSRAQLIEAGEKVETTFIEDWKPLITASLLSDFERNRNFKLGSLSRPQSPQQKPDANSSTNFSPIKRPKSSGPLTSKTTSSDNAERPKSSPSARPKSSSTALREKKVFPDLDEEIYLSGERKPVYKIIESVKETDEDSKMSMSINSIAEKLMSSTSSMVLERAIEQEKIDETIDSVKVSAAKINNKVITLDQNPVSIETFLFNADTFKNRDQSRSPSDAELPHFSSFLHEQRTKLSPQSPTSTSKQEITNVSAVQLSSVIHMCHLSPKQSAQSLHNLSCDTEGDGSAYVGQNLSLDFIPSPSMYSNELVDGNFSFIGSNELFSPHGGSYLEQSIDPKTKSQKQHESAVYRDSSDIYGQKFKLEDCEYYNSTTKDGSLEVFGVPISPKQSEKKKVKSLATDYESITDSSRGAVSPERPFSTTKVNGLDDFPDLTEDVDELNSISPVSSVIIKNIESEISGTDKHVRVVCSNGSIDTAAVLLSNVMSNDNIVVPPVELNELGRSLSIPIQIPTDIILDTCLKKNLQPRRDEAKSPSLVKKLRDNVNKSIKKTDEINITSKFLNDPSYPKINLVSSYTPWKPIHYNPYIDPILNGSTHTWQERKLSHQFLTQDINHMIIDVKKQSASRYEFEKYAEINTPTTVKIKNYYRKAVPGVFGKKKLLTSVSTAKMNMRKQSKEKQRSPVKEVIIPVISRRSAFVTTTSIFN